MGPTAELYASTHHVLAVSLVYALQAISLALFAMADASSASCLGCAIPAVVAAASVWPCEAAAAVARCSRACRPAW